MACNEVTSFLLKLAYIVTAKRALQFVTFQSLLRDFLVLYSAS